MSMILELVFRPLQSGLRIVQNTICILQFTLGTLQLNLSALQLHLQLRQLLNERTLFVIPSQKCLRVIVAQALHF